MRRWCFVGKQRAGNLLLWGFRASGFFCRHRRASTSSSSSSILFRGLHVNQTTQNAPRRRYGCGCKVIHPHYTRARIILLVGLIFVFALFLIRFFFLSSSSSSPFEATGTVATTQVYNQIGLAFFSLFCSAVLFYRVRWVDLTKGLKLFGVRGNQWTSMLAKQSLRCRDELPHVQNNYILRLLMPSSLAPHAFVCVEHERRNTFEAGPTVNGTFPKTRTHTHTRCTQISVVSTCKFRVEHSPRPNV